MHAEQLVTLNSRDVAKILRRKLREEFHAAKISVRCDRGTAYGWINISWADGPVESQVREVCDPWQGADFNGMTDGYDQRDPLMAVLEPGQLPVTVKSHVDGILYQRTFSAERLTAAHRIIRNALPGFDAYHDGRFSGADAGRWFDNMRRIEGKLPPASATGAGLVRWAAETFF